MSDFTLWLEFEEADPGNWDAENTFANVEVTLEDGRRYGLNVWTYAYFQTALADDRTSGKHLNGRYLPPPDLFVREMTRDCVERAVDDLLSQGDLEDMLNPSVAVRDADGG